MEPDKLDAIMKIFSDLPHNDQVELFMKVRKGLLDQRDSRRNTHKEALANANDNIDTLDKGDTIISGAL